MNDPFEAPKPLITDEESARAYVARWGDTEAMERLETFAELLLEENRRQKIVIDTQQQRRAG